MNGKTNIMKRFAKKLRIPLFDLGLNDLYDIEGEFNDEFAVAVITRADLENLDIFINAENLTPLIKKVTIWGLRERNLLRFEGFSERGV